MISKIMEFKTAIWEKAGKYVVGRNHRVLLAVLIGVGMIAWQLLRFAGSLLEVIFGNDKENKSSPVYLQEEEELDIHGRKPGDSFYGRGTSNSGILEEMEEYEKNHSW